MALFIVYWRTGGGGNRENLAISVKLKQGKHHHHHHHVLNEYDDDDDDVCLVSV